MKNRDYYHLFWAIWLCLIPGWSRAQSDHPQPEPFPVDRQIAVDFLGHYYEQDGVHSAVTGGIGTEELTDLGGKLTVTIPLDSVARLSIASSLNHYTSASTDNIDSYVSSASRKDNRVFLSVGYGKELEHHGWQAGGGASFESDYLSTSLSGSWYQESDDGLTSLSLSSTLFLDTWLVIFPEELRAPGLASVPTNKRRTLQTSVNWGFPMGPRTKISLSLEPVVQQGLLGTAFHRVYFEEELLPRIERLPGWRWKLPGSVRFHHYLTDWVILRSFYRFYWDSWGILGHTVTLETPVRPIPFVSIYPYYRFHWQRGSHWFAPYEQHTAEAMFYTSDYDLSGFFSQKIGLGASVYPLYGLLRWKSGPRRVSMLEQLDLRYAIFRRSDGLNAAMGSVGLSFRI